MGVGLGSDRFGEEFSRTGEECDDRVRAELLDESLQVLAAAWTGDPVHHRGRHHTVDGMAFRPRPVRRIPVWVAGFPGKVRPMRRAAHHDGFFPVNLDHPDQLAEAVATVMAERPAITAVRGAAYDVAVALPAGTDLAPYAQAGATWWLAEFDWEDLSVDAVRAVLREGPA
jgi:alkanesulfonate monooxygenase SsuD/methylene tetrahydromethanopterin reductase-like flavin-dependent oxidoreductase (luciferase family)